MTDPKLLEVHNPRTHKADRSSTLKPDFLSRSRSVKHPVLRSFLHFLMVVGPGIIVMEADNDAGAVSTYTQAGALFGTKLFWVLLLLLPVTYFCQEMVVRLGIATGEGHAAIIYKRFGKWWGRFSLIDLELLNFLTLITEFAAISLAFSAFGISPNISVSVSAVSLILLVVTGSYLRWERIALVLCAMDIAWIVFMFMSGLPGHEAMHDLVIPTMPRGGISSNLIFMIIAIVGTTVAPWQLFFQQSCIADKKLRFKDLKFAQVDTLIGATFTIIVAAGMMAVGAVLYRKGITYEDPAQMANALLPIMGPIVRNGLLLLMVNAAVLGTTAISLSSAWAYAEVMEWDHGLEKKFKDAPGFYIVYMGAVLAAAGIVLIPKVPLQLIIVTVQALAGLMLPSAIIFLQLLLNDKELLGDRFANKSWNNWINWTIVVVLFVLSGILAVQVLLPNFLPTSLKY